MTSRTTCLSVSRSPETPPFLRAIGRKRGPWLMRPSRSQVSRRATGQVSGREPRPISTSRQPVLPRMVRSAPSGKSSTQPEPSSVWRGPQSRPTISERRRPPAKPIARIARSRKPAQIHLQGRQHGQELVGEDRGFLCGRAAMAAADAGEHGGDMAIADLERLPELAVAPGDAGQAPLEGGDRKLRAAAFDLRSEIEADRFRIGRRFGKSLAAQPGGEHFPIRGIGPLGVIGLGGAGVVLGGLRERRKAAAEAAGGREQGRGVRAGSLSFKRRAFRLSAKGVPGAFVKIAPSGRMARQRRPGRGRLRRQPRRAGRRRLARRLGPAGLPGPWRCAAPRPALHG